MPLSFYRSGRDAFPDLLKAIRNSKKEILISTYTFRDDRTGREFIRLLTEKAQRGVQVRVIFDALGSRGHEHKVAKKLRDAGVEVHIFRSLPGLLLYRPLAFLCRNHARIFLFDRKYFSLGGIGFGNIYREREDLSASMDIAQSACLVAYFDYLWELSGAARAKNIALTLPREIAPGITALFSGPREEEQEIASAVSNAISTARQRIVIMAAWFLPSKRLLDELLKAQQRGVAVQIITPLRTDKPYYDQFRALAAPQLIEHGVSWRGAKKYFHQKFFIFDDRWIMGSANFDTISMERNYELCIQGTGGETLRQLELIADEMQQKSKSISEFPAPWIFRNLTRTCSRTLEFFFTLT